MATGLISVGLFWTILAYYIHKNKEESRIRPIIRSILPDKEKLFRYLAKFKITSRWQQKQNETIQNVEIIPKKEEENSYSLEKSLLQNFNSNNSDSRLSKTKKIVKGRQNSKNKIRQFRAWISKTSDFNNIQGVDKKSTQPPSRPKSKASSENSMSQNDQILGGIELSESSQQMNPYPETSNIVSKQIIKKYNPFQYDPQQK